MVHGNWISSWARLVGEKTALVEAESGRSLTYSELESLVDDTAGLLVRMGVEFQERVAVLGQNSLEQIVLYFAAARLGAILVPVNWRLAPAEVDYVLEHSGARWLFYGEDSAGLVEKTRNRPEH
ncbi:MAG: hypothetical protein D6806_17245, partial [Deltaproteobacteria bacterium]